MAPAAPAVLDSSPHSRAPRIAGALAASHPVIFRYALWYALFQMGGSIIRRWIA